jgi:hypothetical protein
MSATHRNLSFENIILDDEGYFIIDNF